MRSLHTLQQELAALEALISIGKDRPFILYPAKFLLDTATSDEEYRRKRSYLAGSRGGKPEYIAPQQPRHTERRSSKRAIAASVEAGDKEAGRSD